MKRGGIVVLIIVAGLWVCLNGQTVSKPRLYSYYLMPGQTAWNWKSLLIEWPLALTIDTTGQAHLGAETCKMHKQVFHIGADVPLLFQLDATPETVKDFARVYLNGQLQCDLTDYTIVGSTLTFTREISEGDCIQVHYITITTP